ncbi:MAG: twin-arginine translocation signal domain-containing protein, partial [Candidatus Aminicenantaceae bacterium]
MPDSHWTRRDFLKTTAGVTGAAFAASLIGPSVFSQATDTIKVGLIGCGG